jgi:hypothetical protein
MNRPPEEALIPVESGRPVRGHAMRRAYLTVAIVTLNALIAVVGTNLVLSGIYAIADARRPQVHPVLRTYGTTPLRQVYPELSERQMLDLLAESWGRPLAFEPFTQFREGPTRGRYVNVTAAGFRENGAGATPPWPPDDAAFNVFVFGGSTTFGYGLPDDQTIAARLRDALPGTPAVYNFGRGNYFSSQERVLFTQLLVGGHAPDVAIFIDGLNEFMRPDGVPSGSERLARAYTVPSMTGQAVDLVMRSSLGRFVRSVQRRLAITSEPPDRPGRGAPDADRDVLAGVAARYLENKAIVEAIAARRGIRTVFVWQPVPNYKYDDRAYHLFRGANYGQFATVGAGYALMAERLASAPPDASLLWLADIQEHRTEPLYVDSVHYTAKFSRTLADTIAAFVVQGDRR